MIVRAFSRFIAADAIKFNSPEWQFFRFSINPENENIKDE